MMQETFQAEMERRFGTEEALGVLLELEDGSRLSLDEYRALEEKLGRDAMPDSVSLLPNGGSAVCCTDYAMLIYTTLPGRVQIFGFANEDNPTSRVARDEIHPGGHDFAVVDDRYIVDPWPRLVPMVLTQMVFDLHDPADAALALDIYGPRTCWRHMHEAEACALEGRIHAY